MKKTIISVLAALLAITLVGCNMQDKEQVEQTNSNQEENNTNITENNSDDDTEEIEEKDSRILYLYEGRIVGFVENGFFKELSYPYTDINITLAEIFNPEYYTKYYLDSKKEEKITHINVTIPNEERLQNDAINKLAERGTLVNENENFALGPEIQFSVYELQLPLELSEDISKEKISDNITIGSSWYLEDLEIGNASSEKGLVTNAKRKLNFAQENSDKTLPNNIEKFIEKYKQENGIKEEVKYSCINSYSIDVDHDGIIENIYAIKPLYNNSIEEDYKKLFEEIARNGAYTLLLIEKNGEINIVLDSKVAALEKDEIKEEIKDENQLEYLYFEKVCDFTENIKIYCADFDQDGIIEIMADCDIITPEPSSVIKFIDLQEENYKVVSTEQYTYNE